MSEKPPRRSFWMRFGWFLLLYAGGVGVTAIVAYGLTRWLAP